MTVAIPEDPSLSHESARKWKDFCQLIDVITSWDKRRTIVMLSAYCDASVRAKSGIFCVAGLAFGVDRAKKIDREWRRLFGTKICHMTDLHTQNGEFAKIPKPETIRLHKAAIALISEYASFGVAASVDIAEAEAVLPKSSPNGLEVTLEGFRTPYAVCASAVMTGLGVMANPNTGIAYVFEAGDEFQSESHRFICDFSQSEPAKTTQQYLSHTYAGKSEAPLLQAADVFAWEWAKHVEQATSAAGPKPLARGGLQALIKTDGQMLGSALRRESPQFRVRHMRLTQQIGKLKELTGLR